MVRLTIVLHPDEAALGVKAIDDARRAMAPQGDPPPAPPALPATPSPSPSPPAAHVSAEARPRRLPPKADAPVHVVETYLAASPRPAHPHEGAPLETPLEHAANDLEAIDFLRAHRHQLLGQHARERAQ